MREQLERLQHEIKMTESTIAICRDEGAVRAMNNQLIQLKEKEKFMETQIINVGDKVSKKGGDYRFDGIVVAVFKKLSGVERYVVEDDRGVLHIYGPTSITKTVEA